MPFRYWRSQRIIHLLLVLATAHSIAGGQDFSHCVTAQRVSQLRSRNHGGRARDWHARVAEPAADGGGCVPEQLLAERQCPKVRVDVCAFELVVDSIEINFFP